MPFNRFSQNFDSLLLKKFFSVYIPFEYLNVNVKDYLDFMVIQLPTFVARVFVTKIMISIEVGLLSDALSMQQIKTVE